MAGSSDDEEAPEFFSLLDSKRIVKRHAANLRSFQASETGKKRAKNREKDRRLKMQAQSSKRNLKGKEEERMEKAMRDAEEDEETDGQSEVQEEGESDGRNSDQDSSDSSSEGDKGMDEQRGENEPSTQNNPEYLPDHLFVSAFSKPPPAKSLSLHSIPSGGTPSQRKGSKKRRRDTKDIIVGSRIVRTLDDPAKSFPSAAATIPRRKVKEFVNRSLGLKGKVSKAKDWARKPAHIGVLKSSGPPASFVRSR